MAMKQVALSSGRSVRFPILKDVTIVIIFILFSVLVPLPRLSHLMFFVPLERMRIWHTLQSGLGGEGERREREDEQFVLFLFYFVYGCH